MILLGLLVGHVFADFVFQSDVMAKGKSRSYRQTLPNGATYFPAWWVWLLAHATVHGFMVWMVTSSVVLGVCELVAHALIDYSKCEGQIGPATDQLFHLVCKVSWAMAAGRTP